MSEFKFETLTQFMENISKKLNCLPDYTGDYRHIYKQLESKNEEIVKLEIQVKHLSESLNESYKHYR